MKFNNKKLVVTTLLAGASNAADWKWGMCGDLPETVLTDFNMKEYAG